MNNIIPIYYHIPKCGGTYFYNICYSLHTKIYNDPPILIHIKDEQDNIAFRFMLSNGKKYKKIKVFKKQPSYENVYETTINNISKIFDNIEHSDIHIIIICSSGFKISNLLISQINILGIVVKPYITIRNTFERISSLYYYLTSEKSIHEKAHNPKQTDFESFLLHESNWITTSIMGLNRPVTHKDYCKTIDILDRFMVKDLSLIDEIVTNIYVNIYKQNGKKMSELITNLSNGIDKNSTDKKNIYNFSNLSKETKLKFLDKNTFDRNIYAYFT